MKSKIYTRTGDAGETSLVGGQRVNKHHHRLEAYGSVDELNAQVGVLMALDTLNISFSWLLKIQNTLFEVGSYLATDALDHPVSTVNREHIEELEILMDKMDDQLVPLAHFILPSGSLLIAQSHVCRTVCRRAEREINRLATEAEVDSLMMKYINRLSDFFFILSRFFAKNEGLKEIIWTRSC